ncbi:MAG: pantoate--beta-alanine ligase [Micropepsaceae bacterium]
MTKHNLITVRSVADLRKAVSEWKGASLKSTLVPTMGALHKGHLEIVRMARTLTDRTIVSIFVNPTQFNNPSDLANYPRTLEADSRMLAEAGVDLLFAPEQKEMYPEDFATKITVSRVSEGLCGAFRPGHFEGVATIVAKLFNQSQADFAVLGEKDYQQLHVVRRMTRDLDIPIGIVAHPTVRESDGLAMSSRNARLTLEERKLAPELARQLTIAADAFRKGKPAETIYQGARTAILAAGFSSIEYFELRAERDLMPLQSLSEPARLLAAANLGRVRLIDNIPAYK